MGVSIRATSTLGPERPGAGVTAVPAGPTSRSNETPRAARTVIGRKILSEGATRAAITDAMRLRPLEAVHLAALAVLTTVTLLLWRRLADPGEILLRYALMGAFMAIVVFLVQRLDRLPKALRIAADFYPAAFIPFVFESLGPLIPAARGAA